MNARMNSQWILKSRPMGAFKTSDFEKKEVPLTSVGDNHVLLKVLYLSFDPTQRGWASMDTYLPAVKIGEVMRAFGIGQVIESKSSKYKVGDLVAGLIGWQEYVHFEADPQHLQEFQVVPAMMRPELTLALMLTGSTAYFGVTAIGKLRRGDTLVVSGAAGATGSIAGQLGKILGARVIGIAGGSKKCEWLTKVAHFDAAIDYKSEDIAKRLKELAPAGVNVFFDNVGGETFDAVLPNLAMNARVVICGFISQYEKMKEDPNWNEIYGVKQLGAALIARATLQGFIVLDFASRFGESLSVLAKYEGDGKLVQAIDMQEGFDDIPKTLIRIFEGQNTGKQMLKLSDPPLELRTNALAGLAFKAMGSYYSRKALKASRA